MRVVIILGSGVVKVTSALYLSQAGHEVTVIDRESGPALETSAANAGQISPGYAAPWAAPGYSAEGDQWMLQRCAWRSALTATQFQLAGCGRCCATATPATIVSGKQGAYGAAGGIQPRLPEGAACLNGWLNMKGVRRHASAVPYRATVRKRDPRYRRA